MRILLSNDDGIFAPGINQLAHVLSEDAEVHVFAPDRNRSGASNSLTLHRPIRTKEIKPRFTSVEGTPTDCIHIAMTGLLDADKRPDLVISGINEGENLGDDILYSGTVAAAMEGYMMGVSAIAISLSGENIASSLKAYEPASHFILNLLKKNNYFLNLKKKLILNINIPNIKTFSEPVITRLGSRHIAAPTIEASDPRGKPIYWIGAAGPEADAGPGTDFYAIRKKKQVSITPLHLDLTCYDAFDELHETLF